MIAFIWFCAGVAVGPSVHIALRIIAKILFNAYTATKERPINQCDGCRQGAPLRNGLHIDSNGRAFMACERDKYERASVEGDVR